VATTATAVAKIIGKATRDGKLSYYIDDGSTTPSRRDLRPLPLPPEVVQTRTDQICSVFGPTCDALDVVSMAEELPADLKLGDLLYSENIGAYSHASSTYFNGFPPAKVLHINQ